MKIFFSALAAASLGISATALGASPCTQQVQFNKGASSATYAGHISGYDSCDYVFTTAAGQTLTVAVTGRHSNRITPVLFDPDQQVELSGPIELRHGGTHTVRIIMPRVFARRGDAVTYNVTITIH